jgi:hypothetical protein
MEQNPITNITTMKDLFTLKRDLWNRLTSNDPTLLSEATLQKLIALTDYLENEIKSEYKLSNELTNDIRMLFSKMVWRYKDEEDFELPLDVMLDLLTECIKAECCRYDYPKEEGAAMCKNLKDLIHCIPESLNLHESKIRAIVIHSYIIEKFTESKCPQELLFQIVPSHKEIETRLRMDALES